MNGTLAAEPGPATQRVVDAVIAVWPDHARYIQRSLGSRDAALLATTETLADAALVLAGDRLAAIATNYRWTCDRLREEELFFHREGRYRLSSMEEAIAEVYGNAAYMERYMDGLLLSQVLWFNHAASCHFFLSAAPGLVPRGARMLEIGPGHGLMLYLAMRNLGPEAVTAWDLSAVSVEQTRAALALLGHTEATLAVRDIMDPPEPGDRFDLVVMSEILEHLEDPVSALRQVRDLIAPGGLVFVNVPINSPSPDHLYLMQSPDDARALMTGAGFALVSEAFFTTQAAPLERALRNKVSVSACMFARPAP